MHQAFRCTLATLLLAAGMTRAQDPSPESKGFFPSLDFSVGIDLHCQVGVDFLYWHIQRMPQVPLFTTAPADVNNPFINGTLGQTTTSVVSNALKDDFQPGLRLRGGAAVPGQNITLALEGSYFVLQESRGGVDSISPAEGFLLSRPVINTQDGKETVLSVTAPNQFTGTGLARASSRLLGADASVVLIPMEYGFSFLCGYRYLNLRELLEVGQTSSLLEFGLVAFNGATIEPPATVTLRDVIRAQNDFHGGQAGLRIDFSSHDCAKYRWFLQMEGRVSAGGTQEQLSYQGGSTLLVPGSAPQTAVGGLLALSSNIGNHDRWHFAVVPEVGLNAGCEFGPVRLVYGYSCLYWSNVVRPTAAVDRTINPGLLPTALSFGSNSTPARPAPIFRQDDLFVHGLYVGVEITY